MTTESIEKVLHDDELGVDRALEGYAYYERTHVKLLLARMEAQTAQTILKDINELGNTDSTSDYWVSIDDVMEFIKAKFLKGEKK